MKNSSRELKFDSYDALRKIVKKDLQDESIVLSDKEREQLLDLVHVWCIKVKLINYM